jgi:hypothetical protein
VCPQDSAFRPKKSGALKELLTVLEHMEPFGKNQAIAINLGHNAFVGRVSSSGQVLDLEA